MAYEIKVVRRVEFSETDMAGIVHFSNFFRYMETAEAAFFRSLGLSVANSESDPPIGWPRVHVECDYKAPLRFEDEVEIQLLVSEKRDKSLSYTMVFRKLNSSPMVEVARGKMVVVCARMFPGGKLSACSIPASVADNIQVCPAEQAKAFA